LQEDEEQVSKYNGVIEITRKEKAYSYEPWIARGKREYLITNNSRSLSFCIGPTDSVAFNQVYRTG